MTLHICRDFLSLNNPGSATNLYLQALFLYGVMGFTVVGNTNFNITGSFLTASGSTGSINQGVGSEYAFSTDGHIVSSADINSILTIKSVLFPRQNSGLFRVLSVNTSSNYLILDYRSSDFPPVETNLTWKLFSQETLFVPNGSPSVGGSATGYRGDLSSSNSRLILQSPVNSMQIRLTRESDSDFDGTSGSLSVMATFIPGFSGSSAGDFAVRGSHIHFALWNDAGSLQMPNGDSSLSYVGTPGITSGRVTGIMRFSMWGDNSPSGSYVIYNRPVSGFSQPAFGAYGFSEDESNSLLDPLYRIFSFGAVIDSTPPVVTWSSSPSLNGKSNQGLVAFGFQRRPVFGALAPYSYLINSGDDTVTGDAQSPWNDTVAGDCPFIGATELVPVEVWAGTYPNMRQLIAGIPDVCQLEPRRMGIFPIGRMGRTNFGNYATTSDLGKTWIHLTRGIYLPWSGSALP
jgi:hypothetical protein